MQYGLKCRKRICVYKCHEENCTYTGKSLHELNIHHIDLHGEVQCTGCDKMFKTPSSMKCHVYCHGELTYMCNVCKEALLLKANSSFIIQCTIRCICFIAWPRTVENPINLPMS